MIYPKLTIDLGKLTENARVVRGWYQSRGISLVAVSKAVLGSPEVVKRWLSVGIEAIADSRLANIQAMRQAGLDAKFILTRTSLSEVETVVRVADTSHNTDLTVLAALGHAARRHGRPHNVILMVESGDFREGVMPEDFPAFYARAIEIEGISVAGIGTNMGCLSGAAPSDQHMQTLSKLAASLEQQFGRPVRTVSGGNSSSHEWFMSAKCCGRVNEVRTGELLLLGCEPLTQRRVSGLYTDAFTLQAEVIEVGEKSCTAATAGAVAPASRTVACGQDRRAVVAIGRQDAVVEGLRPRGSLPIVGSSGDHLILAASQEQLRVGDVVEFQLNYAALVSLMTSPFVQKEFHLASPAREAQNSRNDRAPSPGAPT